MGIRRLIKVVLVSANVLFLAYGCLFMPRMDALYREAAYGQHLSDREAARRAQTPALLKSELYGAYLNLLWIVSFLVVAGLVHTRKGSRGLEILQSLSKYKPKDNP